MSKLLECPDCGEKRFSWILQQVQFGNIHEFENGRRDGEGTKMGEVLDADLHEEGPFCVDCAEHKDIDELVVSTDG